MAIRVVVAVFMVGKAPQTKPEEGEGGGISMGMANARFPPRLGCSALGGVFLGDSGLIFFASVSS